VACTSAPEDSAEVYLGHLGCVAARHVERAIGGAVEGSCAQLAAHPRDKRHGRLLWLPTAAVRSQGRERRQVPHHVLLARALATGAEASVW
jgi:hypothetical protein